MLVTAKAYQHISGDKEIAVFAAKTKLGLQGLLAVYKRSPIEIKGATSL